MTDIEIVLKLLKIVHEVFPVPERSFGTHSFTIGKKGELVLTIQYQINDRPAYRYLRFEDIDTDNIDLTKELMETLKPLFSIDKTIRITDDKIEMLD